MTEIEARAYLLLINEVVAEKVMGWDKVGSGLGSDPKQTGYISSSIPSYSTNMQAALTVMEHLSTQEECGFFFLEGSRVADGEELYNWICTFDIGTTKAEAPTLPLAICLAALKYMEK